MSIKHRVKKLEEHRKPRLQVVIPFLCDGSGLRLQHGSSDEATQMIDFDGLQIHRKSKEESSDFHKRALKAAAEAFPDALLLPLGSDLV